MRPALVGIFVFVLRLLVAAEAARVTTMYTIKKFDFWFNEQFFKDTIAFYQPVRGKWGRIYVNLTVVRPFENIWVNSSIYLKNPNTQVKLCFQIDFQIYRQEANEDKTFQPMSVKFSFNVCDIINDKSSNMMFQLVLGIEQYVRGLINKCPIEVGTKIIVPDQTLPSVPRKSQGPAIPSGYYRFAFVFRTTNPNATLGKMTVEIQFRGLWG